VDVDHSFIAQMFEEEVHSLSKNIEEKQPSKKRANPSRGQSLKNISIKDTFKKKDVS
jgi:hypothetical protein